jgi:hypothetical protein
MVRWWLAYHSAAASPAALFRRGQAAESPCPPTKPQQSFSDGFPRMAGPMEPSKGSVASPGDSGGPSGGFPARRWEAYRRSSSERCRRGHRGRSLAIENPSFHDPGLLHCLLPTGGRRVEGGDMLDELSKPDESPPVRSIIDGRRWSVAAEPSNSLEIVRPRSVARESGVLGGVEWDL